MKPSIRVFICALVISSIITETSQAQRRSTGAVLLSDEYLSQPLGVTCGYVNGKWIAGQLLSNGKFFSFSSQIAQVRKKLKATNRSKGRSLKNKLKQLKSDLTNHQEVCETQDPPSFDSGSDGDNSGNGGGSSQNLRFNFSNSIGLVLKPTSSFSGPVTETNLLKVTEAGVLADTTEEGDAAIKQFYIAPNNKLYVLFAFPSTLGEVTNCLLGEVNTTSGEVTCIENNAGQIVWIESPGNSPIQLDSAGAIYYLAYSTDYRTMMLKRYLNGQTTAIINDNIYIDDYLVQSTGSVVLYGRTVNTNTRWLRKLSELGALSTIKTVNNCNIGVRFIRNFPDGKIYVGMDDCEFHGVYRMDASANQLESTRWMGRTNGYNGETLAAPLAYTCTWASGEPSFCGAYAEIIHTTPSQKVYMMSESSHPTDGKGVWQIYGSYAPLTLLIDNVRVFHPILSNLILAGLDANDKNIMTLYDTTNNTELLLNGADNEIEVYNVRYSSTSNSVIFDGLRFADNKYVVGTVRLDTMTVIATPTGTTQMADLQAF